MHPTKKARVCILWAPRIAQVALTILRHFCILRLFMVFSPSLLLSTVFVPPDLYRRVRLPVNGPLLLLAAGVLAAAPGQAQTCSQLRTCAEAIKALQAGNRDLDRDGNGIPCQNTLCKGYRPPASRGGGQSSSSPPLLIAPAVAPAAPRPRPRPAAGPALSGPVELVSVGDGDTIRVRGRDGQPVTVRLACIDAPETAQGPPGAEATASLRRVPLKKVPFEVSSDLALSVADGYKKGYKLRGCMYLPHKSPHPVILPTACNLQPLHRLQWGYKRSDAHRSAHLVSC
jgi:hypothetical protein